MFVNYSAGTAHQMASYKTHPSTSDVHNPNLEIVDVHPSVRGVLGLLADSLGHPVDQLQVEGVLLGNLVLGRELQAVLVVLSQLKRETACNFSDMSRSIMLSRSRTARVT